ncbi:MAG: GNAT family N-acetyltransferase [Rhodospirillales bacterium]|nr:GNAT family N-acetyltransferase [Rhodospirillales bacterium]
MIHDDLEAACRILVDQGLCSGEGLPLRLSATLDMANSDYLVTEENGTIVGVTLSVFDGFSSFVSHMAVAPGAERRHIGRQMIDDLVRRTRERGGKNIVVASWLSAAGFYYSMDFRMPGAVFLVRDV